MKINRNGVLVDFNDLQVVVDNITGQISSIRYKRSTKGDTALATYRFNAAGKVIGLNAPNGAEAMTAEVILTSAELLANYPAASHEGLRAVLTDLNNITVRSDGIRYKPINGIAILGKLGADITTTGAEAVVFQVAIPAGLIKTGDSIMKQISASKSADAETLNYRLRMGTAGTLADTSIQDFTLATGGGGNRTFGFIAEWKVSSATTIDRVGNASQATSFIGPATATEPSPSTIANLDTNNIFISDTLALTGTSTVGKLRSSIITWVAI